MATNDGQLALCTALALSADANLTNVIDLGVARNIGDGKRLSVFIKTTVAADHTTGNETYIFNVVTDDNESLSSPTTVVSQTVLFSDLVTTRIVEIPIPQNAVFEQFLGVAFDGGGTTPTVTITAWLGESGSLMTGVKSYPNGYNA